MNNALLYFGGLLIAVLALLFAGPRFVDWNSYRGVFEEEASRILGREVRVGGNVNLRLLPAPYVSFERLRIADVGDEGASSIIRVESFTMRLAVPPLLKGLIEAHRVELRRPVLNLVINDAGGGNWQSLALAPGTLPFVPKDVTLQSVEIEDGAIVVAGPGRRELARFDAINGELTAEALEGPFRFRGTVNWRDGQRHVRVATAQIDASGDLRFKAAVDVADSTNAYMLDGRLRDLKGQPLLDGELTAKLALAPGQTAAAEPGTAVPAAPAPAPDAPPDEAADTYETLDLEPEAAAPAGAPSDAPAAESAAAPDAAPAPARGGFELKSKVSGTTSGFELSDIAVTLEAGTTPQLISGEARLDWAERMRLEVALASRWLDLDQLAAGAAPRMPLEAARSYFEALASALPAEADTNARLEFDQLTLGGEPIGNVRLAARRAGGPLVLEAVRADLPGGVRLDLDGILTPTPTEKVPRLDGTLFVTGKSLMRFLAWGLDNAEVGLERSDGPFSLDGQFALGDGTLALTDAALVFAGTPLTGEVRLDLGEERRSIAVVIEGPRVDVAQIGAGVVSLKTLKDLVVGKDAAEAAEGPDAPVDIAAASFDLSLDLKVAELIDGDRVLRDTDAVLRLEQGKLSIPRLKFATPEGLAVEAEGEVENVPARPKGAIRGVIAAPNPRAARAFLTLIDGDEDTLAADLDRLAALAPLRLAGTLDLAGGETQAAALSLDGTLGGGRLTAQLRLDGGRSQWRTRPLDVKASVDSPDVARLAATLLDARLSPDAAARAGSGRAVIKATGTPAEGLLALADITAEGLVLGYRGQVRLPAPGDTALDGELRIRSADARVPLALAGLAAADGAAGVPLAGTVQIRREGARLTLDSEALRLGESTVAGRVSVAAGDAGRQTLDATLAVDKASVAALLAPIIAKAGAAPEDEEQDETAAASVIWPEQSFDLAPLGRLDGKIAATIGALAVEPGLTIGNAALEVELTPETIKVARLDGDAVGGRLTSVLDFERAPAGVGLKGSLGIVIAGQAAEGGADGGAGDAAAEDAVRFTVDFTSRALSPAAVVAALTGKGELTVGDATLNGNSPAAVSAVARAALTGQGPAGGDALTEAIAEALKEGEVRLGRLTIPVEISDGALKLEKVRIDMNEGRSTFATAVELATMRIDSEWQIEPKLDKPLAASPQRAFLPPVTVVYTGKLSALDALAPAVSAGALERELVVRKMELDVSELERLRKEDEERARREAERRRALEAERAREEAERQRALDEERAREEARRAMEEDTQLFLPEAWEPDGQAPAESGTTPERFDDGAMNPAEGAMPAVTPSPTSGRPPPKRRKRPAEEEWRPFQTAPY